MEAHDRSKRVGFIVAIGGTSFDACGSFELQHAKDGIEAVRTHVSQRAAAEVGPTPPHKGQIGVAKCPVGGRPEP